MFVGWVRKDNFADDLDTFSSEIIIDTHLLQKTFTCNPTLCFGAYDQNRLQACISAFENQKSILINNFIYKDTVCDETKQRLIKLLLNNMRDKEKSIMVLAKDNENEIFKSFGFETYAPFDLVVYGKKEAAVFNFNNSMAKSISRENYLPILTKIDEVAYHENRIEYIKNSLFKSSSLVLSTENGYQHSYAMGKNIIKISPWSMYSGVYHEAEKMLRGIIYHRGLKKIVACIPSNIADITSLYSNYNFVSIEKLNLMYLNQKPNINLEMVYAF